LPNAFSAFGVFLVTQFIKGIDDEFLEAAWIDGANSVSAFLKIIVPLSRPAVSALAILLFIDSWSMIEQPLIFLSDTAKLPLSLHLGNISTQLYAGGAVFLILPALIYLLGYEDLTNGITLGTLK
jgi:multiple sugar transport system permease protein